MGNETDKRIDERNAVADERMQHQGFLGRLKSEAGLAAANTMDRLNAYEDDDRKVFWKHTAMGVVNGALIGAIVAVGLIAFTPLLTVMAGTLLTALGTAGAASVTPAATAGWGLATFLTVTGASALGMGIYNGQKGLEEHELQRKNPERLSDTVAQASGAVPKQKLLEPEKPVSGQPDPVLEQRVAEILGSDASKGSHATRQTLRRAQQSSVKRQV